MFRNVLRPLGRFGASGNSTKRPPEDETADAATFLGRDAWFLLTISGYQFPNVSDDEWDSNWLVIEGHVNLRGREWRFRDPCMTTFEARSLADWLEALSQGAQALPYCALTEPNLEFDRVSEKAIRVCFGLESAPPWAKRGENWTKHSFAVPIGPALADTAAQLRRQLAGFPERGPRAASNPES